MQICPNDKFIKIFAQDFTTLRTPFFNFFAFNLLFQDASYSLAIKCSNFLFKLFSVAFSGSKSIKFAQKFRIFLKFLTLEGTQNLE